MSGLQASLFPDDPAQHALDAALAQWLTTRRGEGAKPLRRRSEQSYRRLWAAVARFLGDRQIALGAVSTSDLRELLDSRQPRGEALHATVRYGWTVLWLIEQVALAMGDAGKAAARAARELLDAEPWRYANANDSAIPDHLDPRAARVLIDFLQVAPDTWKACRDKAAVALMLGAGLRPGEVRSLLLCEVVGSERTGPWKLSLESRNAIVAHETPMARWASRLLRRWLETREALGMPGGYVFASTARGTAWSEPNLIARCNAVLSQSGIDGRHAAGGLFFLRHTFALRQLARGRSDAELARWLGIRDVGRIARYHGVIPAPVDVA